MRPGQVRRLGWSLLETVLAFTLIIMLFGLMFQFLIPTLRSATRGETMVEMEQEATAALQKICDDMAQSGGGGVSLNGNIYTYVAANACCVQPLASPVPPMTFSVEKLKSVCVVNNSQQWDWKWISLYTWSTTGAVSQQSLEVGGGDLVRRFFKAGTCGTCCIPGAKCSFTCPPPSPPPCPPDLPGQISEINLDRLAINPSLKKEILATGVTWFSVTYPTTMSKQLCPPTIKTQCGFPATPLTITITLQRNAATGSTKPLVATFGRTMAVREQGAAMICGPTGSPKPCP
jgi:hypothetical protein